MRLTKCVAAVALALGLASPALADQTLTPFASQARDMATKAAAAFPDKPNVVLQPQGLIINGMFLDYDTLAGMTVDEVIAFGNRQL